MTTPTQKIFTEADAKLALLRIAKEKGKERAVLLEKMMRIETNHFTSKQYQLTGSAGMEDGLWGKQVKKYFPNGYATVMFRDNHPTERGTTKPLPFIVWNSVYDFCRFLSDYIDHYNGNYARWNGTAVAKQQKYQQLVSTVKSRFNFAQQLVEAYDHLSPVKKKPQRRVAYWRLVPPPLCFGIICKRIMANRTLSACRKSAIEARANHAPALFNATEETVKAEALALLLELELLSVAAPLISSHAQFVKAVTDEMQQQKKHNKTTFEKLAAGYGINDKTEVKELIELAIVQQARTIAHLPLSIEARYEEMVALYHKQVNLSHRTSQSILLQQYSTPAPIAYLAGVYCGIEYFKTNSAFSFGFEPSAGNGLLTIAGDPERFYVNEIDDTRNNNLRTQGFTEVWKRDATLPFTDVQKTFMAVLTNPPFGSLDKPVLFDSYKISSLEHLMALRALDTMNINGKAAIIIGGHTVWDEHGRIQAGKNRIFFNYLHRHYYIEDVININGQRLYSKQGTAFNVRLILINKRKAKPEGVAPLFDPLIDQEVKSFSGLYERVTRHLMFSV